MDKKKKMRTAAAVVVLLFAAVITGAVLSRTGWVETSLSQEKKSRRYSSQRHDCRRR